MDSLESTGALRAGKRATSAPRYAWAEVAGHGGYWGLDVDEGRYQPGVDRLWNVTLLTADELRSTGQDRKASDRAVKRQETWETDRREVVNAAVKLAGPETEKRPSGPCGLQDTAGSMWRSRPWSMMARW